MDCELADGAANVLQLLGEWFPFQRVVADGAVGVFESDSSL
jgi:hypothetical protein